MIFVGIVYMVFLLVLCWCYYSLWLVYYSCWVMKVYFDIGG